jgi:hypothetical protein
MLYLNEILDDSFVQLQADSPAGQAWKVLAALSPSHAIVRQVQPQAAYYLFTRSHALDLLEVADVEALLAEALSLGEEEPVPFMDAYDDGELAPERVVVVDGGDVVGFLDDTAASLLPNDFLMGGGRQGMAGAAPREAGPVARTLATEFPERVQMDTTVSLYVKISADVAGGDMAFVVPVGTAVDIVVEPQQGFALEGPGEGQLVVTDQPETLRLRFKLKATALGLGKIRISAYEGVQPLGVMTLAATVVAAGEPVDDFAEPRHHDMAVTSANQPDLAMFIHEGLSGGQPAYTIRLSASDPDLDLHLKPFGPVLFRKDPQEFFQEFFKDIENLPLKTPEQRRVAERRLAAKGSSLFEELFPRDLQVLLWSLKDRIQTVQIQSEEPWIPWELVKLVGVDEENLPVDGPFLCEGFAITRWMRSVKAKPALSLNRLALVQPQGSGLAHAASERDYLLGLATDERQVERIPARYLDVIETLTAGLHDGWHFTGHGSFRESDPNRSGLELEERAKLRPDDLSGSVRRLGRSQPLVFLNACQVGRSAMSLTDVGGFAGKFLKAGAGAFVGAHWSIDDEIAYEFAQAFYDRLLDGEAIGPATQASRLAVKEKHEGDPTWLAYIVFADPFAQVGT